MSDTKTPLEQAEEVRSLVYTCAGCQSCEFVGGHLLGPVPIKQITALCSAIESQAAEIERLREALEIVSYELGVLVPNPTKAMYDVDQWFVAARIMDRVHLRKAFAAARAALEVKQP